MIAAEVILWGTRIGIVMADRDTGIPKFSYDPAFLNAGIEVSPIMMPASEVIYSFPELPFSSFQGLPGLLADSLPDKYGNSLIREYLTRQGRSPDSMNSIEKLCYIGMRGMGALEYRPALDMPEINDQIHIGELVSLAEEILSRKNHLRIRSDDHAVLQLIQIGSSAGGARAKALIAWNEETDDIRSGQVDAGKGYTYWLMKFDNIKNNKDHGIIPDKREYTKVEYAYYLMAKHAGITMSECRLYKEDGGSHFLTKRFDRTNDGKKIHMQSLGAIAHYDFNTPGANSYEEAAIIMNRLGLSHSEAEELYRRMIFNELSKNYDDHVKNISFLMDRNGNWTLSPAYDVTYAFHPDNPWLRSHQMRINGKREHIEITDMLQCASRFQISEKRARRIIEQVSSAVRIWSDFAQTAGLSEDRMEEIRRHHVTVHP